MSVLSPPEPREDELELLIREARARQRRWVGAAALVAILAGTVLGIRSIATAKHASSPVATGGGTRATTTGTHCGFRVAGTRVLASDGSVVYSDPSQSAMWHDLRCSGSAVWRPPNRYSQHERDKNAQNCGRQAKLRAAVR